MTGSTGTDLLDLTVLLFVVGAVARAGCVLFVAVLVGADNAGDTQTAGSSLLLSKSEKLPFTKI